MGALVVDIPVDSGVAKVTRLWLDSHSWPCGSLVPLAVGTVEGGASRARPPFRWHRSRPPLARDVATPLGVCE
jgi:hypothetical protein